MIQSSRGLIKQFLLITLLLIMISFGLWFWTEARKPKRQISDSTLLYKILQESRQEGEKEFLSLQLFFASRSQFSLDIEERELEKGEEPDIHTDIRRTLLELIKGPTTDGLAPTIPPGTELRSFYLDKKGIGYVDFSKELVKDHPQGSWGELVTIYSVVNTLIKNFPQVHQVKLLVDGVELETLHGHIDIRRAFSFNESLGQSQKMSAESIP